MSQDWPLVSFQQVVTHRKEFVQIDDTEHYKRCRVQLHARGIVLRDVVSGAEIKTKQQQVCKTGEFLVAEIDAKVGGFGIVPPELDKAVVSSHYFLFALNNELLDERFLGFFLRTPAFMEQVEAQGTTNYAAIRPTHVLNYHLPLPPLAEQRRIVARIEALAGRIAEARGLRQQAMTETDHAVASISSQVFTSLKQRYGTHDSLGELARVIGGGTPAKHNAAYWNGAIPWVSPKDMKSRIIQDTEDHITERAVAESSTQIIPRNSLLLVARSGILRRTIPVAINACAVTLNQDMKALVPSEKIAVNYLRWWFKGEEAELLTYVKGGTTVQSLEWNKFIQIKVPLPPLPEQQRIVAYLDDMQGRVDALKALQAATAAELDALLPSVLDQAFRGEL